MVQKIHGVVIIQQKFCWVVSLTWHSAYRECTPSHIFYITKKSGKSKLGKSQNYTDSILIRKAVIIKKKEVTINAGKDMERELSYAADGNVN